MRPWCRTAPCNVGTAYSLNVCVFDGRVQKALCLWIFPRLAGLPICSINCCRKKPQDKEKKEEAGMKNSPKQKRSQARLKVIVAVVVVSFVTVCGANSVAAANFTVSN